jgi:VanZ family protein
MDRRHAIILWMPPLLWAALIFTLSAQSNPPSPGPAFPLKDKLAHLALYAVLGCLLTRALRRAHGMTLPRAAPLAIILAAIYGAADEWHQSFVALRTPSFGDWLADVCGAALGQLAHFHDTRPGATTNR